MRRWLGPVLSLGALAVIALLPHPVIWTIVAVMTALFWYLLMTGSPRTRRWEDVKNDHRRDSPRSSR